MHDEFSADEIKDAARLARIYCPGFNEEKFKSLMELEERVDESGYLEAIHGLILLEQEKGITCIEALDTCEQLGKQKETLEKEIAELESKSEHLLTASGQAAKEYEQLKETANKAKQDMKQIENAGLAAREKLQALNEEAEKEKERTEKLIEEYHQQAALTRDEVATASQLQAEVEKHGFSLDLMLDIAKEFTVHKDAKEKLAEALKRYGTINKYLDKLESWYEEQRGKFAANISELKSEREKLVSETGNLRNTIAGLKSDINGEEDLRRFYRRYKEVSRLMEHLASWKQVFFVRCTNPLYTLSGVFNTKSGNVHFWTDQPPTMCPRCGYRHLVYDESVYESLNIPVGSVVKLQLEGNNGNEE